MKRLVITFLAACFATSANAQNTATPADGSTSASAPQPSIWNSSMLARGIRVGVTLPKADGEYKVNMLGVNGSMKEDADASLGVSVGYAHIPVGAIGGLALLNHTSAEFSDGDYSATRIEGSATYGLSQNVFVLGGLNINKFTSGDDVFTELDAGVGLQLGVGFQATQNFGVDIKYVTTKNEGKMTTNALGFPLSADLEYETKGIELGVNATF